jgi:tetratricopeptide (TPR) repeat protein
MRRISLKDKSMKKSFLLALLMGINLYAQSYSSMKKEALRLFKEKKIEKSYQITKKFIKSHPKEIKGKNLLATLYYWNKEYNKSKKILEEILKVSSYSESKKLYRYVQKKLKKESSHKNLSKKKVAKKKVIKTPQKIALKEETTYLSFKATETKDEESKKIVKNVQKPSFKSLIASNKKEDLGEFDRLAALIESDPKDLKSRELLAKYYLKVGLYQRAYDFAREALVINPQNGDMKKIVNHLSSRADIDTSKVYEKHKIVDISEAKEKLKKLFDKGKYTAYVNLYKALVDGGIKMNKKENENALFSAVNIGEYKFAKEIISTKPLPHSRLKDRLNAMLLDME